MKIIQFVILILGICLFSVPFLGLAHAADEIPFRGPSQHSTNPTPTIKPDPPSPTPNANPSPTAHAVQTPVPTNIITQAPVTPTNAPITPDPTNVPIANVTVSPTPTSLPQVQGVQVTIQPTSPIMATPDIGTKSDPPSAVSYAAHDPALENLASSAYNNLIKAPLSLFPFPKMENYYSQEGLPKTTTAALVITSIISMCGGLFLIKPRLRHL